MFLFHNAIYKPVALSPADKRRKRELQFEQKFQEVLEDEGGSHEWTEEDLIDRIVEGEKELYDGSNGNAGGIVDPENLGEKQSEKVYELMEEHFWEHHTQEEIKKEAEDYVDPELDNRFTAAHEAYEQAVAEHGADSSVVKELESKLDSIEEEWNETVSDSGDAWDEARIALENVHWEQYYDEIINANFKSESNVRTFLHKRYQELEAMGKGGDVWRGVVMESVKDPGANYVIGQYWTDKKELARPFLKEMNKEEGWHDPMVIRYHARVDGLDYVNLVESMEANAWAYIHDGYPTDMNEVRFFKYAPIYVYEAERLDTNPYGPDYGAEVLETYAIEEMRRA